MLGCIQPMSSPMMKRMLGFCGCCAAAGTLAAIAQASSAERPRQTLLVMLMDCSSVLAARNGPAAAPDDDRVQHSARRCETVTLQPSNEWRARSTPADPRLLVRPAILSLGAVCLRANAPFSRRLGRPELHIGRSLSRSGMIAAPSLNHVQGDTINGKWTAATALIQNECWGRLRRRPIARWRSRRSRGRRLFNELEVVLWPAPLIVEWYERWASPDRIGPVQDPVCAKYVVAWWIAVDRAGFIHKELPPDLDAEAACGRPAPCAGHVVGRGHEMARLMTVGSTLFCVRACGRFGHSAGRRQCQQ